MGILNGIFGSQQPSDPLERAMLAHAGGQGSAEWLTRELRGAHLVVLLEGDSPEVVEGAPMRPLTVSTPIGYAVVCAFTSAERAQVMRAAYPTWRTEVSVDYTWVIATLPAGHGIVINPGHAAFLFQAPEDVDRLRGELGEEWRAAA